MVLERGWKDRADAASECCQERPRQVYCSREDILDAERAFYGSRMWHGKRMMGFSRWMGMDNLLHAVAVLDGPIRLHLDERDQRDAPARSNGVFRWWA